MGTSSSAPAVVPRRAALASMIASDVFENEVQNAVFGPAVRIVAPGGKRLLTLEA
jgi:hypothetical protein